MAAEVFDVHLDGVGLRSSGAIDVVMASMLFAYMQELREHLRYRRISLGAR